MSEDWSGSVVIGSCDQKLIGGESLAVALCLVK